jgi:hypothetical protein
MRFLLAADTIKVKNPKKRKENAMLNPVHKRAGQITGQRPQIEAQGKFVRRDGRAVSIRVATPDDKEKLRRMFSRLSSKSIYRRFHHPYQRVPEQMLNLMLNVDHHDKESLVAVTKEEIVGHAMYVKLADSGDAEVAFVVEDEWQSKGGGNYSSLRSLKKPGAGTSRLLPAKCLERTGACSACSMPCSPKSHT